MQGGELYFMAETPRAAQAHVNPVSTIAPKKRGLRWTTPFGVATDFVKGTGIGLGFGIERGAKLGLKLGLAAGTVAFFAPVLPVFMSIATAAGLPGVGMVGFNAIAGGLLYAFGGAMAGAAAGGALGVATGGAKELQLRYRREKYAEELAERAEMRSRERERSPRSNWRGYAQAVRQDQRDNLTRLQYFENENRFENFLVNKDSWVDRIHQTRQHSHYDKTR